MTHQFHKIVWIGLDNFIAEYVSAFAATLSRHTKLLVEIKELSNPRLQIPEPSSTTTLYILSLGTRISEIQRLPPFYIIHQTEQYSQPILALPNSAYHAILKSAFWIWDYSRSNIGYIKQHNRLEHISLLPFSYLPELEYSIPLESEFKYEALFIGTLSRRRIEYLKALTANGLRVKTAHSVFGAEKRKLISEAAILLNIHYDTSENTVLETERIGYLLANRCCIVSEFSSERSTVDNHLSNAVVFISTPEEMVAQCKHLLQVPGLLEFWREQSYQWFKENCSEPLDFSSIIHHI